MKLVYVQNFNKLSKKFSIFYLNKLLAVADSIFKVGDNGIERGVGSSCPAQSLADAGLHLGVVLLAAGQLGLVAQ